MNIGSSLSPHQILLALPSGSTDPVMHQHGFTGWAKELSVKADLAIYSHVLAISGWSVSVSLILAFKLYFNSCLNWGGICKFILKLCCDSTKITDLHCTYNPKVMTVNQIIT